MSYGSNDTFGVFLAHSVQTLWWFIGLPVSSEISDFTLYAHAQSNVLHT